MSIGDGTGIVSRVTSQANALDSRWETDGLSEAKCNHTVDETRRGRLIEPFSR